MSDFENLRDDISSLPTAAQQLVVDFVAFLKQRYSQPDVPANQPLNLKDEPFVGMWNDRTEMADSTAWVRQIRQQHWRS